MTGKVCIIGAGPSGLALMCWLSKLEKEGRKVPEIVCFEKQSAWGGLWNYSWRTGLDEHGEPVHGSMYKHLWSNGPKECLEFPYYTFEDHFGKPIPSFPPREVLFDYLKGRWSQEEIEKYVNFSTAVKDVVYNEKTDNFTVVVKDLVRNEVLPGETFDYVVVASGHYSVPNIPAFKGLLDFPGRVLHSHDYRNPKEFAGKKLLLIGASYSAEDIAIQSIKYAAESVICTYRTKKMGFNWPNGVEERPLVQSFDGKMATFLDGTSAEVDVVIMCTGYLHSYPFLRENLRLKCKNTFYPPNLYKGIVWTEAANNKLMYLGVQDQCYTYTMFDICGLWAAKCLLGEMSLPAVETMKRSWKAWEKKKDDIKDGHEAVVFQTGYVQELASDCGADYPYDLDVADMFHSWLEDKVDNVATYRDAMFASKYTGNMSTKHGSGFMVAMDDSLKSFVQ